MSTTPVHESNLPPVLTVEHMAQLLGMSVRTVYEAMKRPSWPFTELRSLDRKKRWSRDMVLSTINAGTPIRTRKSA